MIISWIDVSFVALFFIGLLLVARYYSKKIKNMEDFVLGGRKLPMVVAVGTMMATWLCTFSLAELAFTTGIIAFVAMGSLAHYSKIPMAIWVGPKVQFSDTLTLPEMMRKMFDHKTGILAAILMVFYCTSLYGVTGLGVIGKGVFNIDPYIFTGICVVVIVLIALTGGLMSVAVTDFLQMFFMMVSVAIALLTAWPAGGWTEITQAFETQGIAQSHLALFGTDASQIQYIFTYFVLAFSAYADPTFYQRFSAADSAKSSRRSLLICIPLWLCWACCVAILGILGRVYYPEMTPGVAYLSVCLNNLPIILKGIFLCGLIGGFVSTLSSYWLVGGTCISYDIFQSMSKQKFSEKKNLTLTRLGTLFVALFAYVVANNFTMMATAWSFVGSIWCSGALAPVLLGLFYRGRISANSGFYSLLLGCLTFGICSKIGTATLIGIQPLFISLPVSAIVFIIAGRFGKETVFNRSGGIIHV